jgi:hypothetical protein
VLMLTAGLVRGGPDCTVNAGAALQLLTPLRVRL